jgi:hypothetical protein
MNTFARDQQTSGGPLTLRAKLTVSAIAFPLRTIGSMVTR